MFDARAVANFLLDHGDRVSIRSSNLKMNKIVYFAHGLYLANFSRPLVRNHIEAWKFGPVIRVVYDCFKDSGDRDITNRAFTVNLETQKKEIVPYDFDRDLEEFLSETHNFYGRIDALKLMQMTHAPGSPWDNIWNRAAPAINFGMRIPNVLIQQYFANPTKRDDISRPNFQ